jgi:hypothetical protein
MLGDRERAKLPIYEGKITQAERLRPRDNCGIIICSIPLIGISVAQRLWPGQDDLAILLTPEELCRWQDIYKHPEDAFQWWITTGGESKTRLIKIQSLIGTKI